METLFKIYRIWILSQENTCQCVSASESDHTAMSYSLPLTYFT